MLYPEWFFFFCMLQIYKWKWSKSGNFFIFWAKSFKNCLIVHNEQYNFWIIYFLGIMKMILKIAKERSLQLILDVYTVWRCQNWKGGSKFLHCKIIFHKIMKSLTPPPQWNKYDFTVLQLYIQLLFTQRAHFQIYFHIELNLFNDVL